MRFRGLTAPAVVGVLLLWTSVVEAKSDPLDPLYKQVAADLRAGKPLVVTVYVALCDNRAIACGSKRLGNGDRPRTNLYWGGAAGLRAYFDHRRGYKRVFLDQGDSKVVLERVVYRRRVRPPSPRWLKLGVRKAFEIYLVGYAIRGTKIGKAAEALVRGVAQGSGTTLKLPDGTVLAVGGRSHVIGYAGHNHFMDVVGRFKWPRVVRKKPVGYFMLACQSAQYLAPKLTHPKTHALLLTKVFMYPGAFTIDGLIRGLALAEPQRKVFRRGCAYYAKYQRRRPALVRRIFTHDGRTRYRKKYPGK
ncbi:MAG: hypothetical protein ABI333_29175 [bacterium]